MATEIQISKRLATAEDISLGDGTEVQTRNGSQVTLKRVNAGVIPLGDGSTVNILEGKSNILYGDGAPTATINPSSKTNSFYVNELTDAIYFCKDATTDNNIWKVVSAGDGGDFLTKTEVDTRLNTYRSKVIGVKEDSVGTTIDGSGVIYSYSNSTLLRTYEDSSGILRYAGPDEERYEVDGTLIEDESTNILYPSDLSNSTITYGSFSSSTGPDGIIDSATKITEDTEENSRGTYDAMGNAYTLNIGDVVTVSLFVRAIGGRDYVGLWFGRERDEVSVVDFDLTNDSVISTNEIKGTVSNIEVDSSFANDWKRLSYTVTMTNAVDYQALAVSFSNNPTSSVAVYQGDGSSYIEFFGGQIEPHGFSTSYTPTTTSIITRQEDELYIYTDGKVEPNDFAVRVGFKVHSKLPHVDGVDDPFIISTLELDNGFSVYPSTDNHYINLRYNYLGQTGINMNYSKDYMDVLFNVIPLDDAPGYVFSVVHGYINGVKGAELGGEDFAEPRTDYSVSPIKVGKGFFGWVKLVEVYNRHLEDDEIILLGEEL